MTTPYTYIIGWTYQKKFYYGVRFARGCSPSDLWVSYFTSSKQVRVAREQWGEPDLIMVRRTFDDIDFAKDWEHTVLRRLNASKRTDFLNLTDNRCNPSNAGIVRTADFKHRVSIANRGKVLTETHKQKIAAAVAGKRPKSFGDAVSAGMVGMKQSRETVEKRRAKQLGQKRSAAFCEQTRLRVSIPVQGPDGTKYQSISDAHSITGIRAKKIGYLSKHNLQGWGRITPP